VTIQAVRAGLLAPAARIGDRRRYTAAALDRDPEGQEAWRTYAATKLAEFREEIARLEPAATVLEHTLACPAPSLAECPTFAELVRHVGGRQGA
jgi:hypothetical protein